MSGAGALSFDEGVAFVAGGFLDKAHHLNQRHGRIMRAKNLAIGAAELFQAREIFLDVDDIPGQAHEMLRSSAALGEDIGNVAQRLTHLRNEIGRQMPLRIPADHAAGHHKAAIGGHAVGISFRHRPAARLQHLRAGR